MRKILFMDVKKVAIIILMILVVSAIHVIHLEKAFAQYEGDDFFEDDGASDPIFENPTDQVKGPPDLNATQRFMPPNDLQEINNSEGGNLRQGEEDNKVVFRLIDPPKFWKPKKRKRPVF
ncbi:MAG: hypothetical protein ABL927_06920 [Bdellovibrionales bacterium]